MTTKSFTVTKIPHLKGQDVALFIRSANSFDSSIALTSPRYAVGVNAKSMLGVMTLEIGEGTQLQLTADGPDEGEAVSELMAFFA